MVNDKGRVLACALAFAAAVTVSSLAAAAPDCSVGRNRTQGATGVLSGRILVDQAFDGVGRDVARIDEFKAQFLKILRTTLRAASRSARASDALLCRALGLMDGVVARLDELQVETDCEEEGCENSSRMGRLSSQPIELQRRRISRCWMDGVFWGELAAALYCSLSIELDGLVALGIALPPRATNCCGVGFELACNLKFASEANNDPLCEPYTLPPHEAAYLETKRLQCTFEL